MYLPNFFIFVRSVWINNYTEIRQPCVVLDTMQSGGDGGGKLLAAKRQHLWSAQILDNAPPPPPPLVPPGIIHATPRVMLRLLPSACQSLVRFLSSPFSQSISLCKKRKENQHVVKNLFCIVLSGSTRTYPQTFGRILRLSRLREYSSREQDFN